MRSTVIFVLLFSILCIKVIIVEETVILVNRVSDTSGWLRSLAEAYNTRSFSKEFEKDFSADFRFKICRMVGNLGGLKYHIALSERGITSVKKKKKKKKKLDVYPDIQIQILDNGDIGMDFTRKVRQYYNDPHPYVMVGKMVARMEGGWRRTRPRTKIISYNESCPIN